MRLAVDDDNGVRRFGLTHDNRAVLLPAPNGVVDAAAAYTDRSHLNATDEAYNSPWHARESFAVCAVSVFTARIKS